MSKLFSHEKLNVDQRSLQFISWLNPYLNDIPTSASLHNQLDSASTSIPLSTAEGNGKWTSKDRCRFFDIAHGSALECAAALDIASVKGVIDPDKIEEGKVFLQEIVNMLIGLLKANDPGRTFGNPDSDIG